MKPLFPRWSALGRCGVIWRGILSTILLGSVAGSGFAASITGGAVTGGSAFTAGGTFVELGVPWGSVSTPSNTVGDANFLTPNLYGFSEAQNVTLSSTLTTQVGQTSISAGTLVNSFFVTVEPGGVTGFSLIGHVDFSGPILGIITSHDSLVASNFLGAPGITYLDPPEVGLEPGDSVTIDASNPDQIDWNTTASTPGDSVRVILGATSTATVPEPSGTLLSVLGLFGVGFAIRRKRWGS